MPHKQYYIYPYRSGSKSVKALASVLDCKVIKREDSKFKSAPHKIVINWGASQVPLETLLETQLNRVNKVRLVGDKLSYFKSISHISSDDQPRVVPWTDEQTVAQEWLSQNKIVMARTILTGHSGNGIIIVNPGEELPRAALYTQYVPKDSEWRIHIAFGEVIDWQRKVRKPGVEPTNWKIRSHQNGFIFIRDTEGPPEDVLTQAMKAFKGSGLDFGAIDVIWNQHRQKAYVLEINTAPGLEGQTVTSYVEAFKKRLVDG